MEVNGRHALAAFYPREKASIYTGWASELVIILKRREKYLLLTGINTKFHSCPVA